jgi:hypothetical protein
MCFSSTLRLGKVYFLCTAESKTEHIELLFVNLLIITRQDFILMTIDIDKSIVSFNDEQSTGRPLSSTQKKAISCNGGVDR